MAGESHRKGEASPINTKAFFVGHISYVPVNCRAPSDGLPGGDVVKSDRQRC